MLIGPITSSIFTIEELEFNYDATIISKYDPDFTERWVKVLEHDISDRSFNIDSNETYLYYIGNSNSNTRIVRVDTSDGSSYSVNVDDFTCNDDGCRIFPTSVAQSYYFTGRHNNGKKNWK